MSHEIETMAFANATPWHGLGARVDSSITTEEMLKAAGLDWYVKLMPSFAWDAEKGVALPIGRNALVRSIDNRVLTVAGEDWKPLQNRDMMEFFREFCEAGKVTMETAGSLRGGKIVWALANLGDGFVLSSGDAVKGYLLLVSPHEVGNAITVMTTSVRVVCANTLAASGWKHGRGKNIHRQHHTKTFSAEKAKEAIGLAHQHIAEAKEMAETLSAMKVSEFDATSFLANFFQQTEEEKFNEQMAKAKFSGTAEFVAKALETPTDSFSNHDEFVKMLLSDPEQNMNKNMRSVVDSYHNAPGAAPGTGWGILNAVTHWADHKAGREADARLHNAWLGERARLKVDVQDALLEMAA